jgi:hypothetical protein
LQKVKNSFAANEFRKLTSNMSILMQILFNDGLGDWRELNEAGRKHQAVTAADVKRVMNKYFTRENRTVAIYTRKVAKSAPDAGSLPDLTGFPAEQQTAIRAMASQIKAEKDAEKLKSALRSMEAGESQADEKTKSILQFQKKLVQQRLEELKR